MNHRYWILPLILAACSDVPSSADNSAAVNAANPAGVTVRLNGLDDHGPWEGWGTSMAWWANATGNSNYQNVYADLFFSQNDVPFLDKTLPGLGMNIVRYNVGGGARGSSPPVDAMPVVPANYPWFKDIDGYWLDWNSQDPASPSWDFTRDANQRAVLAAARQRGVNIVEFFSDAPMWWMTDSKSSAGGNLEPAHRIDLARYVATVAQHARDAWGIDVSSVEAFNEPSAGWWGFPKGQEGCNIPKEAQREVLSYLTSELHTRGLDSVAIAASDENTMTGANTSFEYFKTQGTPAGPSVADVIGKVNVHGYSGITPWRDNAARRKLRATVGSKRLWMSEYGDNDGAGMAMAQTIMEDLVNLKPSAWIYWQALEPTSGWGMVNGEYGNDPTSAERTKPKWIYNKYYVMAQFTRFLRAGATFYGTSNPASIAAYDDVKKTLSFVTVTYANPQQVTYDLTNVNGLPAEADVTVTNTAGDTLFQTRRVPITNGQLVIDADKNSIQSVVIPVDALQ